MRELPRQTGGSGSRLPSAIRVAEVRSGSWSCKNTLPREVDEKLGPVRSQAVIAAITGLVPTMFMARVRL